MIRDFVLDIYDLLNLSSQTGDSWITLGVLIFAIVFFLTEWLRVDVVAIIVVIALMLTGVLTTDEAIAGFSNSLVIAIVALFVVGGGVMQTDLAVIIGRRILKISGTNETQLMVTIMLTSALLSGFMSNTGTVAVLLPATVSLARSARIAPSRLLIPLAFGSSLGGAMTLIGTPPNIVVSDLLKAETGEGFGFFEYSPIGVILLVIGVSFMIFAGKYLLPEHRVADRHLDVETPEELMDLYRLPDNIYRLRVRKDSSLTRQTIASTNLRKDYDVNILEVKRPAPVREDARQAENYTNIHVHPDMILQPDDILIVQGERSKIGRAVRTWHLALQPRTDEDSRTLITDEAGIAEVILPPRSSLVGRTLSGSHFRERYNLGVLAVSRPGTRTKLNPGTTELRPGDGLLVQGTWKDIASLKKIQSELIVMGEPEAMIGAPNREKAPIAFTILMGMLVVLAAGWLTLTPASLLAGLFMIMFGCLSMDDAYDSIDWKSVVLIAGMLPMSTALTKVGIVDEMAFAISDVLGDSDPVIIVAGFFLMTAFFTQVLSNTATAVLLAPIAVATATELDVSPEAFLMTIGIAASMAFGTPIASPVNTLVMGAGNYSFNDYLKVGLPLIFLTFIVSILIIPRLFPF